MARPLLNKIGTKLRLIVAGTLLAVGFALASITPLFFGREEEILGLIVLGVGCLAMFAAIPIAVRATICPKCKLRWLGYSMSHLRANEWLPWLFSMQRCPKCGYSGDD